MMEAVSSDVQRILEAAMKLSDDERAQLIVALFDSIGDGAADDEMLRAWAAEARQRLADIRSGVEAVVPAVDLFKRGRAMIEEARRQRSVG